MLCIWRADLSAANIGDESYLPQFKPHLLL
jgi:hypothetical protein